MNFLSSLRLPLDDVAALRIQQESERRCIRTHVEAGIPVDEMCATSVDRYQDEIDRQEAGMPLPEALAAHLLAAYGRTGPKSTQTAKETTR